MWSQGAPNGFNFNAGINGPYGSLFLNEIHNNFPAILYRGEQFHSTHDVFQYIQQQMRQRYDVFSINQRAYDTAVPRPRPRVNAPARRHGNQTIWRENQIPPLVSQARYNPLDIGVGLSTTFLQHLLQTNFMDPVPIVATAEQLAAATVQYSTIGPSDSPCAVCQDTIAEGDLVRKLNGCSHIFHSNCIDVWLQRNVLCPVCRHDIRQEAPIPSSTG